MSHERCHEQINETQAKLAIAVEALEELEQLERGHETYQPGDKDEPVAHRVAREALAKIKVESNQAVPEWHGCKTGDCPHEKQVECDKALAEYSSDECVNCGCLKGSHHGGWCPKPVDNVFKSSKVSK